MDLSKVANKSFFGLLKTSTFLLILLFAFIIGAKAKAAVYHVNPSGNDSGSGSAASPFKSLAKACSSATAWGDVIQLASGTFNEAAMCNLSVGVKIQGAGKAATKINSYADPSIRAVSGAPVVNGSNEISGIGFYGNGGTAILSQGRSNQKIHDNYFINFSRFLHIYGKQMSWKNNCESAGAGSASATYCDDNPKMSIQPANGDWADGIEIYRNEVVDARLEPNLIRGAKIYENTINNSNSDRSAVGWTSFWWNNVDFYNNRITMKTLGWTNIALEVWMVENNSKFRNNWTNGWFSVLNNPNGPKLPYSWQITGNRFESNVAKGANVGAALETSYNVENVLIADNFFQNTGSNKTYNNGIAIWGNGVVKNFTIRNNIFKNLGGGIEINTTDITKSFGFNGSNINVYNNVFDNLGDGNSVGVYISDGSGTLTNVKIKNNIFKTMNYGALIYPSNHNVTGVEFSHNSVVSKNAYGGKDVWDYGRGGFSLVANNYNFIPESDSNYKPLSSASNIVDKGTYVGLDYSGLAPDLGAFEFASANQEPVQAPTVTPPPIPENNEPSCAKTSFLEGSVLPEKVHPDSTYNLSCNYGIAHIDSVKAKNDLGQCTWNGWEGTNALFSCPSGASGTRTNICYTITGTESNTCASVNPINNVTVISNTVEPAPTPASTSGAPVDGDPDNDGIKNSLEAALGTDPNKADSDNDGYNDRLELINNYNPLGSGRLEIDRKLARYNLGRILLQGNSLMWYLNPTDLKKYFISGPYDLIFALKKFGTEVGHNVITNISQYPQFLGKFLIDLDFSKTYYYSPVDKKLYYISSDMAGYNLLISLGMNLMNNELMKIGTGFFY